MNLSATGMESHLKALHPEAAAATRARDELRQQGRAAEAALQHIMADPAWEAKISQIYDRTFVLMERVVRTLRDFFDATEALSSRSASVAKVVPSNLYPLTISDPSTPRSSPWPRPSCRTSPPPGMTTMVSRRCFRA